MIHGTYVGDLKELKGKKALLQFGETKATIKAQFDDLNLGTQYTHGWQSYPVSDFKIEQYCVVMFEPAAPIEKLTLTQQVNEVFGPFNDSLEVDAWTERAEKLIQGRQWLVIPMSDPSSLNACDPEVN